MAEQRTAPRAEAARAQRSARGADRTSTPRNASTQSAAPAATGRLRLELVRSPIGTTERQRATVRALGLRRLHQVVEQPDSPVTRGMILKVNHLVKILDQQE